MNRLHEALGGAVTAVRERLLAVSRQSERTALLGMVLLMSAVSAATGYIFDRSFSVDVPSSLLLNPPEDCSGEWGMKIGRHCFSDYAMVVNAGLRPNPFEPLQMSTPDNQPLMLGGPVADMLPHLLFGLPAKLLGAPILGLIGYLLALTIAVLAPAVWAARGAYGLERVVVFVVLSAAAIPAWAVIDRGNSVGFVVPIALVFLVALRRQRWGLVAIMVVLAALVKPQFAILVVALLAARQWRLSGLAVSGVAISQIGAFLLWPRDFPVTFTQSIHNLFNERSPFVLDVVGQQNVSFGKALLMIPDTIKLFQTGGKIPPDFLAGPRSLIGYVVLIIVVVCIIALGRRISPVMAGIVLLATAALFPPLASFYYLVVALPVAALVVRDPDGPPGAGIFDRLAIDGDRRRVVGVCVSLAAAFSIAQIALGQPGASPILGQGGAVVGTRLTVVTTIGWAPVWWLIACAVIIVSYARRAAASVNQDQKPAVTAPPDAGVITSTSAPS